MIELNSTELRVELPVGSSVSTPSMFVTHPVGVPLLDPTPEMLVSPEFEAVWKCIRTWDIGVPSAYFGYTGAMGTHVRAILDALNVVATIVIKENPDAR